MPMLLSRSGLSVVVGILFCAARADLPLYDVKLVTSLQGNYATGVTDDGYVVGRGQIGGFVYTEAQGYRSIDRFNNTDTQFYAVNSSRTVAGAYFPSQGSRGLTWSEAKGYKNLAGGIGTYGAAINELGGVAGSAASNGKEAMAKWSPTGTLQILGNLQGSSFAFGWGNNDQGDVCGEGDAPDGTWALLWTAEQGLQKLPHLPGSTQSTARDVNDRREVVGTGFLARGYKGFLWTAQGGIVTVDPLAGFTDSDLEAINDSGWAVGVSSTGTQRKAMLWSATLGSVDMNTLLAPGSEGWTLESATAIDPRGDVVGNGLFNGVESVFYAKVVPEPACAIGFAVSGASLLLRRRILVNADR